jgi:predicted type IV restriction endonuclease
VKSILRTQFDANRIVYRDAQSYFSVLVDDNNRKPVCRLYLEGVKKGIVVFDENKKETKQ